MLADADEGAIRKTTECAGEALGKSEDAFWLQNIGRLHRFCYDIAVVIGVAYGADSAVHEEEEPVTRFTLTHYCLALCVRRLAEVVVGNDLLQVVAAHALEQWQLKQAFVQRGLHGFGLISNLVSH